MTNCTTTGTLLERICNALGWQGGTIHDVLREVTVSKPYNVRRYGKEFYGTVDVWANDTHIGTIDSWFSDIGANGAVRRNPGMIQDLIRLI